MALITPGMTATNIHTERRPAESHVRKFVCICSRDWAMAHEAPLPSLPCLLRSIMGDGSNLQASFMLQLLWLSSSRPAACQYVDDLRSHISISCRQTYQNCGPPTAVRSECGHTLKPCSVRKIWGLESGSRRNFSPGYR